MSVYVVVDATNLDEERALAYRKLAEPTIEQYGGRYRIQGATPEPAEGLWPAGRVMTMVEFPDRTHADRWYFSTEYEKAKQTREGAIDVRLLFVEGGKIPPGVAGEIEMTARTPEELLPMVTAAINAGDPSEVVRYWDEEGCFALPDGELVRGHTELLAMYEQRLALQPEITTHAAKIVQAGDVALVTNVWSTRLRNGRIDGKDSFEGIATLMLRRHTDGSWRILVDST